MWSGINPVGIAGVLEAVLVASLLGRAGITNNSPSFVLVSLRLHDGLGHIEVISVGVGWLGSSQSARLWMGHLGWFIWISGDRC